MRWLHLLPQPNTFPDVQSNFHLKLHNHGIKVCSLPPPSCLPFSWHESNIWRSLIPFLGVALFYRYVRVLSSPSTHIQIPAPASPTTFPLLLENRADDSSLKSRFGSSSLHQRDPRSALFENYNGGGSERKPGTASPSRPGAGSYAGGYGYAGAANGSAGGLGAGALGYRPATPNSR